jgi:hypothetical protein
MIQMSIGFGRFCPKDLVKPKFCWRNVGFQKKMWIKRSNNEGFERPAKEQTTGYKHILKSAEMASRSPMK